MKQLARDASFFTRRSPRLPKITDRSTLVMEHVKRETYRAVCPVVLPHIPLVANHVPEFALECQDSAFSIFGVLWTQADHTALPIHVAPKQALNFTLSPARQIAEASEGPEVFRQAVQQELEVSLFKEPLANIILLQMA